MSEAQSIIDELNASYLYGMTPKSDALAQRIIAILTPMATPASPLPPAEGEDISDTVLAQAARKALGTWLAWPDAPRDGPVAVTNEQAESWVHGLPQTLAALRPPATSQSEESVAEPVGHAEGGRYPCPRCKSGFLDVTETPTPSDDRVAALVEAAKPFADCTEQISQDEDGEEWAKFRLLVKNYRDLAAALSAFDKAPSNAG